MPVTVAEVGRSGSCRALRSHNQPDVTLACVFFTLLYPSGCVYIYALRTRFAEFFNGITDVTYSPTPTRLSASTVNSMALIVPSSFPSPKRALRKSDWTRRERQKRGRSAARIPRTPKGRATLIFECSVCFSFSPILSFVELSFLMVLLPNKGPTSTTYLLHSQALISSRTYENYDTRYHHSWDISTSGDGVIQVHEPQPAEMQATHPKPVDLRIERDVIETLVNAYFREVAPILPIVTREEFVANSPPPPILLFSVCLVAAARREVPSQVFDSVRYAVNNLIKAEDVLSTASIVNMQSLLVLSMVGDCHSSFAPSALSTLWVRLGAAIRMVRYRR